MPSDLRAGWAACLALGLAAFLVACGGGAGKADRTPSPTKRPTPSSATATVVSQSTQAPAGSHPSPTPACADPYPGGAPFEPQPDRPIRLRPVGAPPELPQYNQLAFTTDHMLERVVRAALGTDAPHVAVVIKDLADGHGFMLDPGRQFYAASLYKTWVMLEAFHQREAGLLDFGERYIVSPHYKDLGLNPGELDVCDEVTLDDAMSRMMSASDNVAANLVLDRAGPNNINSALRGLGLSVSVITPDGSLTTTAGDTALLMEAISRRQVISEAVSDEMLALLAAELVGDRLPTLLPAGTRVVHKTGSWENATHDAGIVYSPGATYVIAVLTDFGYTGDGARVISHLSRSVYDYYNPP